MPTLIENFWAALQPRIEDLAISTLTNMKEQLVSDGRDFFERTKEDLARWTGMLTSGALTRDEFKSLVNGKRDLAEMLALKGGGLALIEVDRLRAGIVSAVIGTAFSFLPVSV
jgi:hypothetical protein